MTELTVPKRVAVSNVAGGILGVVGPLNAGQERRFVHTQAKIGSRCGKGKDVRGRRRSKGNRLPRLL